MVKSWKIPTNNGKNLKNHNSLAVVIFPRYVDQKVSLWRVRDRHRDVIDHLPNNHSWRYNHVTSAVKLSLLEGIR